MKRLLTLTALSLLAAPALLQAQEALPGICVNSRQPLQIYLNKQLVCENSLNCVIVNLRPQALYLVEARHKIDPDTKPIYSERVKVPEKGIHTVVIRTESQEPSPAAPARDPNTVSTLTPPPSQGALPVATTDPFIAPSRTKTIISEDKFDEFIGALDKATPAQAHILLEGRIAQNNFLVKHIKQILEMYLPGDQTRIDAIKKSYHAIADRENAFQLVNTVASPEAKNQVAEFIAAYNAKHPL